MSTIAIPPIPSETYKVEGSSATAVDLAKRLASAANVTEHQQDFASGEAIRDIGVGNGIWEGSAAMAYRGAIAPFAAETSTAYTGLKRGSTALYQYADKLAALKRTRTALATRRGTIANEINSLVADVNAYAGREIPPDVESALRGRAADLQRQVDDYETANDKLESDTDKAEKALTAALGAHSGVSSTGRSLTAQGFEPGREIRSALDKVHQGAVPSDLDSMSAKERARWWAGLTATEREAMLQEFPEYLGNGHGLPPSVRDIANRQSLDRDIAQARAVLATESDPALRNAAQKTLDKALHVQGALEKGARDSKGAPVQLYGYDSRAFGGDGKAIVSIGNLDTAKNVAWNVPGMTTDIMSTEGNVNNAVNLYNAAEGKIASVAWIGYDAPSGTDTGNVATHGAAHRGGDLLAADLKGFTAARDQLGLGQGAGANDKLNLHVIGHSYGSATVGWAGDNGRLAGDVDSFTLIGSPGAGGTDNASEFGVGQQVYVGSSDQDPVTRLGGLTKDSTWGFLEGDAWGTLGADPSSTAYGAQRFRADDGAIGVVGTHNSYYDRGTESLRNLARIVTGQGGEISYESRRSDLAVLGKVVDK